jgi:hypothetical protein
MAIACVRKASREKTGRYVDKQSSDETKESTVVAMKRKPSGKFKTDAMPNRGRDFADRQRLQSVDASSSWHNSCPVFHLLNVIRY